MERRPFTITKVHVDADGVPHARVTCDGVTIQVDRRYGSWQASVRVRPGARTFRRAFVLPHVAAELQRKVKAVERREGVTA
jgi:hypothetical protein